MPYRTFVRALDDALRDTQRARQAHSDPNFDKELQKDRRATLRRFATVESALRDREKAEKERRAAGVKAGPGAAKAPKTKKVKATKK